MSATTPKNRFQETFGTPSDRARTIEVEEAYGHCPRAFKFANLWDAETIAKNQQKSV